MLSTVKQEKRFEEQEQVLMNIAAEGTRESIHPPACGVRT